MNGTALAICEFLAGLAFSAVAGTAWLACRKTQHRQIWQWLGLLGLLQGAAAWTGLLINLAGPSRIGDGLQIAVWAVSCVGLVEFGQRLFEPSRAWLLPRWSYFVLGAMALLCFAFGHAAWLAYEYRLVLAWQGGAMGTVLLSQSFARSEQKLFRAISIAAAATLIGLVTTCLSIAPLSALAALMTAAAGWLGYRQASLNLARPAWLRECVAPAAFLLIAAAGSFGLARSQDEPVQFALAAVMQAQDHADAGGSHDGIDGDESADSQDYQIVELIAASPKVRQFGVAFLALAAFVLIIFGLSRLPAAR